MYILSHYDQRRDVRIKKGFSITNRIEITSKKSIAKFLKDIGFTNPKLLNRIVARGGHSEPFPQELSI